MRSTDLSVLVLAILFVLFSDGVCREKVSGYASPGLRLGYTFGEGPTIGLEISLGVFHKDILWNSAIVLGIVGLPSEPSSPIKYIALQGGFGYFGASYGLAFHEKFGIGNRFTTFAGVLVPFVTWEHLDFTPEGMDYNTFGIWFKVPILEDPIEIVC